MKRPLIILLAMLALYTLSANAQKVTEKSVPEMHVFGYALTLADSTIYLTELQQLPFAKVTKKYKFLVDRAEYSKQLKDYLESQGKQHPMCTIFFDKNRDKLLKKMSKIVDKTIKKKQCTIKSIPRSDFSLSPSPSPLGGEGSD